MLKGVLTATTDFNIAINSQRFHGTKTIYMGDPAGLDPNLGFTVAGPLVPSYECMAADIDGTEEQFNMLYTMQLQSLPAAEFFAVILAALFNGKSLVLYFPSEAKGLKYINGNLNYISSSECQLQYMEQLIEKEAFEAGNNAEQSIRFILASLL